MATAVVVLCLVGPILPCDERDWPFVATATGVVSAFAAHMTSSTERPGSIGARAYVWFLPAAVSVPSISLFLIAVLRQGDLRILAIAPLATMMGLSWSLPIGLVLTTALLIPLLVTIRARHRPTLQGVDRARALVGLWMAAVATVSVLTTRDPAGSGLASLLGAAGAGLALVMTVRILGRRRWLTRVREGRIPAWAVVSIDVIDDELPPTIPRWDHHHWSSEPEILCAVHRASHAGPYRDAHRLEPRFQLGKPRF